MFKKYLFRNWTQILDCIFDITDFRKTWSGEGNAYYSKDSKDSLATSQHAGEHPKLYIPRLPWVDLLIYALKMPPEATFRGTGGEGNLAFHCWQLDTQKSLMKIFKSRSCSKETSDDLWPNTLQGRKAPSHQQNFTASRDSVRRFFKRLGRWDDDYFGGWL